MWVIVFLASVLFLKTRCGVLVLSSGIVAVVLNFVLPQEVEVAETDDVGVVVMEEQKHQD